MKDSKRLIEHFVAESVRVKSEFFQSNAALIAETAEKMAACASEDGRKVLLFGNGGSAADAQHIAAEFVGRFIPDRRPLPALSLSTDTSALTALGNDYGYSAVFARQVQALGNAGDVAIGNLDQRQLAERARSPGCGARQRDAHHRLHRARMAAR